MARIYVHTVGIWLELMYKMKKQKTYINVIQPFAQSWELQGRKAAQTRVIANKGNK